MNYDQFIFGINAGLGFLTALSMWIVILITISKVIQYIQPKCNHTSVYIDCITGDIATDCKSHKTTMWRREDLELGSPEASFIFIKDHETNIVYRLKVKNCLESDSTEQN